MTTSEMPTASYPGVAALVHQSLPEIQFAASETKTDVDLEVGAGQLMELVRGLKDHAELDFDYLGNIAGVDLEGAGMAIKYQFYSFKHGHRVQVTVPTAAGHPQLPTLTGLYAAANWHEREAAEMFGFVFEGHPDPRNLLLEEDLHIHPLLKAHPLQPAEMLQGLESDKPGYDF